MSPAAVVIGALRVKPSFPYQQGSALKGKDAPLRANYSDFRYLDFGYLE